MIKTVDDYVMQLQEKFPYLETSDIKTIVNYGWRMVYKYTLYGCDITICNDQDRFWFHLGQFTYDSLRHFSYYIKKLRRKIRLLYKYKFRHTKWDGYYYTGLTDSEIAYMDSFSSKKKIFEFNNKILYKIEDEAKVAYSWSKRIIKFKYLTDVGFAFYRPFIKIREPKIILIREHAAKMKDILVSSNNYTLL